MFSFDSIKLLLYLFTFSYYMFSSVLILLCSCYFNDHLPFVITLQRPKAAMPYKPGFEEDGFLKSLAPFEAKDIELKADNCTKVTKD